MNSSTTGANVFVRPDSYVTLHYRIELASGPAWGSVFADTFTGRPATLQLGVGQWAEGMEQALIGRAEGEHFTVDLPAAQAYGERNPELLQWVSRGLFDQHADPDQVFQPGELIEFSAPNGGRYSGVLKDIQADRVLFDFNHPLAGVDLHLEVSLLGVL